MTRHLLLPPLALAAALSSPVARAQYAAVAPVPPSDADALAAQMRIIAAEPTDIGALVQAGELSARLGDLSGAASLFARADKVDPRNGRVKAGMAEVLLRSERPGEALRLFDQAEGYGYPPARFAAERGLAYDLVGQQGRAQRDYREVLAANDTAEVRRRYALSLGIAGQGEAAIQELDPLIRRNDRGAWRSRAFILAMQGDVAGATTIATTMMAPGQAQGLALFFARLASLGPVDRAFAVHFGELRPTPQRLADARLAPALSPLAPETVQVARATPVVAPIRVVDRRHRRRGEVQLAAAIPIPAPMARPPAYGTVASATAAIARPPAIAPVPVIPAGAARSTFAATSAPRASRPEVAYYVPGSLLPRYGPRPSTGPVAPIPPAPVIRTDSLPRSPSPSSLAPAALVASTVTIARQPVATAAVAGSVPAPGAASATGTPVVAADAPSRLTLPAAGSALATTGLGLPASSSSTSSMSIIAPVATSIASTPIVALPSTLAVPSTRAMLGTGAVPSTFAVPSTLAAPLAIAIVPPASGALATTSTDGSYTVPPKIAAAPVGPGGQPAAAIAASKVAGPDASPITATAAPISTAAPSPGNAADPPPLVVNGQLTEAGRAATAVRRRAPNRAAMTTATPAAGKGADEPEHPARVTAHGTNPAAPDRPTSRSSPRDLAAADATEPAPTRSRRQRAANKALDDAPAETPPPIDRKALARKAVADRKALADKKAAAEAKALADKDAVDKRKARKAEPERYWVQVAGGANEDDLAKTWSATRAKAPALAGRKGWSTPLRATNRVITGPFKTDEEAHAFVNTLKKQGVSAFPFTSDAGQKITRLEPK